MPLTLIERPVCEICGMPEPETLLVRPFTDAAILPFLQRYYGGVIEAEVLGDAVYQIAACRSCGLMWQRYVLDDAGMNLLYDVWISAEESLRHKTHADLSLFTAYARDIYTAVRLLKRKPHQISALDFGMGWGYWCLMAKAFGINVYGLELSSKRIAYARANAITVLAPDDLQPEQFDYVNADQVFEHLTTPLTHLKRIQMALKPGGIVRLAVPDGSDARRQLARPDWRAGKDALHPLEHINTFTGATLTRLAQEAGLEPLHNVPYVLFEARSLRSLVRHFLPYRLTSTRLYFRKPAK